MANKKADADKSGNGADTKNPALPLFYKQPAPLDAKKHAKLALKENFGLGFTEGINAVPVNLIEFPQICHFYPIAFSPFNKCSYHSFGAIHSPYTDFLSFRVAF